MTNKHTPGPWAWKTTSGYDYGSISYWIPGVCTNIKTEANARLIAESPALLEELRRMRKHWRKDENDPQGAVLQNTNGEAVRNWIDRVDAVLSKVEGAQP